MNGKRSKLMRSLKYLFVLSLMAVWYNFEGITAPVQYYYCANTQLFPCNEVSCTGSFGDSCDPDCFTWNSSPCNESLHIFGVWPACLNHISPYSFCDPAKSQITCLEHYTGDSFCWKESGDPGADCEPRCVCIEENGVTLASGCV